MSDGSEDLTTYSDYELTWVNGSSSLETKKRLEFQRRERWHAAFVAGVSRAGRSWDERLVVASATKVADLKYGKIPHSV